MEFTLDKMQHNLHSLFLLPSSGAEQVADSLWSASSPQARSPHSMGTTHLRWCCSNPDQWPLCHLSESHANRQRLWLCTTSITVPYCFPLLHAGYAPAHPAHTNFLSSALLVSTSCTFPCIFRRCFHSLETLLRVHFSDPHLDLTLRKH